MKSRRSQYRLVALDGRDVLRPIAYSKRLAAAMNDCRPVQIDGAGNFLPETSLRGLQNSS